MKYWVELVARSVRTLLSWIFSFALWTLWLGLAILLAVQIYIISANELALPDFALRYLESRLADSGVRATFGRTSFDPAGRVLIENVRLSLPAFNEPIVTIGSAYVRLNPWMLSMGRLEPREVRLTNVSAAVPAMLSPSGQPEEIISDLDITLEPLRRAVVVPQLSARIAGVTVSAHGTLMFAPQVTKQQPALDSFAGFIANRFPALCRQALTLTEQVAQLDAPALHLEFTPSESGATLIEVLALARAAKIKQPIAAEATDVSVSTRLLLFGDVPPSDIRVSAGSLRLPGDTSVQGVHARVLGRLRVENLQFDLREAAATADTIAGFGVDARSVSVQVTPRTPPVFESALVGEIVGSPLIVRAESDLAAHSGVVRFNGLLSPRVLEFVSQKTGADVRKFFDFDSLRADHGEARFGADWKFERLTARVLIPRLRSYGIAMQDGRALIELEPGRLYSPEAFARVGENFARGSYEHDLTTNNYRFLLQGRLRPLDIAGWFKGDWWTNFFKQLEFPAVPPEASVDVRGSWRDGRQSNVFVFADVPRVTVRGTPLDRVRTRLFVRPDFYDGLEFLATHGNGDAHGRFTYVADTGTHAWHTLELAVDSTLDLKLATQLLGPETGKILEPFRVAFPPAVKLRGQITGPAAPGGANTKLDIEAHTTGEFRYHDFPLRDVSFLAKIDHDDVTLDNVKGQFASGSVTGHARIRGAGDQRRLAFDLVLDDASLGQVAGGLEEFFAAQNNRAPAPPGKFVQEKANVRLNFTAAAEGRYDDPFTFHGDGSAILRGAEIGEVPLFGLLSELLKFTALRFTEARANFKIDGPRLVFSTFTLRGANSAVDAHGTYALDRRELDFNAKIFPFQASDSLLKNVVGAVLTPLSNAFELKLTGSLAKPEWAFARGPTTLLRSLTPGGENGGKPSDDKHAGAIEAADDKAPKPPDTKP